jgi:transposase-like protein
MHPGARAEPVLCAWGITTDGKPVLLALDGANAESTDACLRFLRGLAARGLRAPLLVITDGAGRADRRGRAGVPPQPAAALPWSIAPATSWPR